MGVWMTFSNDNDKFINGSFCYIDQKNYWYGEDYVGQVIELREWNELYDSDFYAVVWSEEDQEPIRIIYDTTRFSFCAPNGAKADATPEVIEKLKNWIAQEKRIKRIKEKWADRERIINLANLTGTTRKKIKKLEKSLTVFDFNNIINLLKSAHKNRLRSEFRKQIAQQVYKWLDEENPKYNTPLSNRQLNAIAPYHSWTRTDKSNYTMPTIRQLYGID